jgi:hypothetical protein
VLSTDQKGSIAEIMIAATAIKLGTDVYKPIDDGTRCKRYSRSEIDAFAGYSAELDRCYFLPFDLFPQSRAVSLRLGRTRNNQAKGINWAEEYEFGATLGTNGAIAQLGERVHGMHEVAGSSPAGSTELQLFEAR